MSAALEGNRVRVRRFGREDREAPTLLLLHGRRDAGSSWPGAIPRWRSDWRVLAWDARGHGESPRFSAAEIAAHPITVMYEDLIDLLEDLTTTVTGPVVLVGHSMGAGIAAAVAARRPELICGVVLEEPAWYREIDWTRRRYKAAAAILAARAMRADPEAAAQQVGADNPRWAASESAACAWARTRCDDAFLATAEAFLPEPWRPIVEQIAVPTLVVTGTQDVIVTAETIAELELLGHSTLTVQVVPGASHNVRRDEPEGYHAVVDPWLSQLVR